MWRLWMVIAVWCGPAQAELQSLFPTEASVSRADVAPASLFSGGQTGFFAPVAPRPQATPTLSPTTGGTGDTPIDQLLGLIARAEAGPAGYNAVQYGATIRPHKPPTQMTLGEIYDWIDATPGQPHAIGRYQFIPPTLRRVAAERGFGPEVRFSPGVQDALAVVLLEDAGLSGFRAGEIGRQRFMYNLARIWAGLPLPNGRSYYEGHAGNSATMTWAAFSGGMQAIWPGRS
ncbi:MAG: hypothetical protein AAGL89_18880 [Pseudomonadota bacterium]